MLALTASHRVTGEVGYPLSFQVFRHSETVLARRLCVRAAGLSGMKRHPVALAIEDDGPKAVWADLVFWQDHLTAV